jgi:hypothetical protein
MNQSLTHEELEKHRHDLVRNDRDLHIIRYEVDIDPESQGVTQIVLSLRSSTGIVRRLRFTDPQIPQFGPLQIPGGLENGPIYVVDIRFKGWATMKVEVGSDAEDRPTFFFAERVEEIM